MGKSYPCNYKNVCTFAKFPLNVLNKGEIECSEQGRNNEFNPINFLVSLKQHIKTLVIINAHVIL